MNHQPAFEQAIYLPDEQATLRYATAFAKGWQARTVITFSGVIGSGKTCFIRALLHALGVRERIKSPTFSLVEGYSTDKGELVHSDLYRIHAESLLVDMLETFDNAQLLCIEWPENVTHLALAIDLHLDFTVLEQGRQLNVIAHSATGKKWLQQLETT